MKWTETLIFLILIDFRKRILSPSNQIYLHSDNASIVVKNNIESFNFFNLKLKWPNFYFINWYDLFQLLFLCRQRTRVKDDEEEVETGCCYTCCIHCFASGCRGCFTVRNVTPRPSEYPPSPRPSVRSVSIQAEEIPTLRLEEVVTSKRAAKELKNYWKPHRHDIRNNNQSTKWSWHLQLVSRAIMPISSIQR